MSYPTPDTLQLPVTPYSTGDYYHFKTKVRSRGGYVTHLGDDVVADAKTPVHAIGKGEVVYAAMRLGSPDKRSWGGLVVIGHTHRRRQTAFYSVYGHLHELHVKVGQMVGQGQVLGRVAPPLTADNGWWRTPHVHFGVYVGPWQSGMVLPGYKRWWQLWRTKLTWWEDPHTFITTYNQK